jgi:hypothetical protein
MENVSSERATRSKDGATMAIESKAEHEKSIAEERPFAHLRAAPEVLERLRAMAPPPRSLEEWLGPPRDDPEAELAELAWFLQEREALRQGDIARQEERLTDLTE